MKKAEKIIAILLTAALLLALLSGCGNSPAAEKDGSPSSAASEPAASGEEDGAAQGESAEPQEDSSAAEDSQPAGEGEVTWTWGSFRGLYGDAEVTFNEDGGRDTVLMNYPNGTPYMRIQYTYEQEVGGGTIIMSGKAVYPIEKSTFDGAGTQLYNYVYSWSPCDEKPAFWGAGVASDIKPILEAGEAEDAGEDLTEWEVPYYSSSEWGYDCVEEESTGSTEYQDLSHLMVGGQGYQSAYEYGGGYWLTKRVDGNPAKTWFYAADGRLDEDLTLTWHYDNGQPASVQMGQYPMDTYKAESSDGGRTVTYTLDESYTAEDDDGNEKDLARVYTLTLSRDQDGRPAMYQYTSYEGFINTEEPLDKKYSITYQHENGVLSGAVYQTPSRSYTTTCDSEGMLESVE